MQTIEAVRPSTRMYAGLFLNHFEREGGAWSHALRSWIAEHGIDPARSDEIEDEALRMCVARARAAA